MASHFSWYPSSDSVKIPWNARFSFPSQANKTNMSTPRISPKNGSYFSAGQTIRLEFPAQGYVNPANTTIIMDVVMNVPDDAVSATGITTDTNAFACRFQNNIQSIFQRVRLIYGSTVLEDMNNYNTIVRSLTEWTANSPHMTMDQSTINEGIGGVVMDMPSNYTAPLANAGGTVIPASSGAIAPVNVRQKFIHGISSTNTTGALLAGSGVAGKAVGTSGANSAPPGWTAIGGYTAVTHRYQIQLALGLFSQGKLIPVKFMASQLAIEMTLEQSQFCLFTNTTAQGTAQTSKTPTYGVGNIILLPEVLEFDPSYDAVFLKGLQEGGVPLKYSSWDTFIFSTSSQNNVNLNISERNRSVKSLFVLQKRAQPVVTADNGATFFDTSVNGASTLQQYQFRIGARYFPGQPVQTSSQIGSAVNNGGAEAWLELSKALKIVGDYRLSTPVNISRWAVQPSSAGVLSEHDFDKTILYSAPTTGIPTYLASTVGFPATVTNGSSGTTGSSCFGMAINLETSNGVDISGLNAEEQSDISFMATWSSPQVSGASAVPANLEVYAFYDAMIILRENNLIELVK